MARITEKNRRYRTREQIAHDLAFVLRAPVSTGTKIVLAENAFWVWTEYFGKYEGCPYWTRAALARYIENRRTGAKKRHRLRHEHVVPRDVLLPMLLTEKPPTADEIRSLFDKLLIGVVVELDEDLRLNEYRKVMPSEFSDVAHHEYRDPWLRYKRLGIELLPAAPDRDAFRDFNQLLGLMKKVGQL